MHRTLMKSKLHRATITDANLHYVGSITLDRDLMDAADLYENERVQVVDVTNGARLETYVIGGPRGAGDVCLNGAAARLVQTGDTVIVMSYGLYADAEAREHVATVVLCDETNRPERIVDEVPAATADALV